MLSPFNYSGNCSYSLSRRLKWNVIFIIMFSLHRHVSGFAASLCCLEKGGKDLRRAHNHECPSSILVNVILPQHLLFPCSRDGAYSTRLLPLVGVLSHLSEPANRSMKPTLSARVSSPAASAAGPAPLAFNRLLLPAFIGRANPAPLRLRGGGGEGWGSDGQHVAAAEDAGGRGSRSRP